MIINRLDLIEFILKILTFLIPVLVNVAFVTLLERKILGFRQIRLGPTKVGFKGILQPFSDAIKLFLKQFEFNSNSNSGVFLLRPIFMFRVIFTLWVVAPGNHNNSRFNIRIILFVIILRVGVYPLLLRGWASNSKYAVLGSLRGVAQTISYEIRLALILIRLSILCYRINFYSIEQRSKFLLLISPIIYLLWFVIIIAETNRTPFDFSEGESELVSGFNIEYASVGFVLIFLAEYSRILLFSSLGISLFIGIELFTITSRLLSITLTFIWVILRSTFPRYRYDILINIAWKSYLPQSLAILILISRVILI